MKNNEKSESTKKRKIPFFGIFYIFYIIALCGAMCFGFFVLWDFLDVYEKTRPVHFMEDAMVLFDEDETEQMQKYLTNTAGDPYKEMSAVLPVFYDSINEKDLTFAKLSGKYTEEKPVYAVLADKEHVATVSFVSNNVEVGYNLCGWKLDSVSLLVNLSKSFAVTIPSSMSLTINGIPVAEQHKAGITETNTPVDYINYICTGELYFEPEIQVTDRYGNVVELKKDEATGGLYYQLSYAMAPATMQLEFGTHVLTDENVLIDGIPVENTELVSELSNTFSEYAMLPELINVPTFRKYFIDFAYAEDEVTATDRFGQTRELVYDETTRTYSHELISNDTLKEECKDKAIEFLETYTLFCANDAKITELEPFFPADSEFLQIIEKLNAKWFDSHTKIEFSNHQLKDFFAYTDDLVYIYVTLDQNFTLRATGEKMQITVDIPLWLVKMEDTWYVAKLVFDDGSTEE